MGAEGTRKRFVLLGRFSKAEQAHMVASVLESEGIPAQVETHHADDVFSVPQLGGNPAGIAVRVPSDQVKAARSILEQKSREEYDGPGCPHE